MWKCRAPLCEGERRDICVSVGWPTLCILAKQEWGNDSHPGVKEGAVTFVAIWFGVAVVVGALLGYAARRLKRAPRARQEGREVSNENTNAIRDRREFGSSSQSSMKTKKVDG